MTENNAQRLIPDTPYNDSVEATLLRLSDIPDYLTSDRRKIWFDNLMDYEVQLRQRNYQKKQPLSHMKKLINFVNDYLDNNRLADTPLNQLKAKNAFYLQGVK